MLKRPALRRGTIGGRGRRGVLLLHVRIRDILRAPDPRSRQTPAERKHALTAVRWDTRKALSAWLSPVSRAFPVRPVPRVKSEGEMSSEADVVANVDDGAFLCAAE